MRRLHILHRTYYSFSGTVQLGPHRLLLRPREGHDVQIESATLAIAPDAALRWSRDEYDNALAVATFDTPAQQLAISSEVVIRHDDASPLDFVIDSYAVNYPFRLEPRLQRALQPFLAQPQDAADVQALRSWVQGFWVSQSMQTYGLLLRLCTEIHRTFTYRSREEPGVQSVTRTLAWRSGSCRDFARLFMEAARSLELPARFVSGYLFAPNTAWDFGATHAWTEVYLPGAGWRGFDPTLGELASGKHIAVAVSSDAEGVPPVAGTFFGVSNTRMSVGVWVSELASA